MNVKDLEGDYYYKDNLFVTLEVTDELEIFITAHERIFKGQPTVYRYDTTHPEYEDTKKMYHERKLERPHMKEWRFVSIKSKRLLEYYTSTDYFVIGEWLSDRG